MLQGGRVVRTDAAAAKALRLQVESFSFLPHGLSCGSAFVAARGRNRQKLFTQSRGAYPPISAIVHFFLEKKGRILLLALFFLQLQGIQ